MILNNIKAKFTNSLDKIKIIWNYTIKVLPKLNKYLRKIINSNNIRLWF